MKPLLLSLLFIAPLCAQTIDVTQYGANPNGGVDNTAAINKAFAAATANPGSEVLFPCGPNGSYYLVKSPITFPSSTTIVGTHGGGCQIVYQGSGSANTAYNFVNVRSTTLRDLALYTLNQGTLPATIAMLGGTHGADGQLLFDNVTFGGYATTAMVYSISSENNVFRHVYFDVEGGGTGIGFYTSAKDDMGICGSVCQDGSNLSLTMDGPIVAVSQNLTTPFTAFEDKTEGGTGDHQYRDGYIGLGTNPASTGFTFISGDSTHGGPNSRILIQGFRIENGGYAMQFLMDYQTSVSNLDVAGLTWDTGISGAYGFIYGANGLRLSGCRFAKNLGENRSPNAIASVDQLWNSVLMEDYGSFTVRTQGVGNYVVMMGKGTITMPSFAYNTIITPGTSTVTTNSNGTVSQ